MKRMLLAVLAGVLLAAGSPAAGGEAEKAAATASGAWLAIVDAGRYGESWDAAAATFRQALTKPQWIGRASRRCARRSASWCRAGSSAASSRRGCPGRRRASTWSSSTTADFEKAKGMTETVTPMKDPDGTWRVSGYYIK